MTLDDSLSPCDQLIIAKMNLGTPYYIIWTPDENKADSEFDEGHVPQLIKFLLSCLRAEETMPPPVGVIHLAMSYNSLTSDERQLLSRSRARFEWNPSQGYFDQVSPYPKFRYGNPGSHSTLPRWGDLLQIVNRVREKLSHAIEYQKEFRIRVENNNNRGEYNEIVTSVDLIYHLTPQKTND